MGRVEERIPYLTISSGCQLHYNALPYELYMGLEPQVSIILSKRSKFCNVWLTDYRLARIALGGTLRFGMCYWLFEHTALGVESSLDMDFTQTATSPGQKLRSLQFSVLASVSYQLL